MLPTFSRLLYEALEDALEDYAENYAEMSPEEWASGAWFVERDDGRENWLEYVDDY